MAAAISVPKFTTYTGTPVFFEVAASTTPGSQQTLISQTVPASITRYLHQVVVVCRMEGNFRILSDGQMVGSGRTGAAQSNVSFSFNPPRPLATGTVLEVLFESRVGSPVVNVEAFVQAADQED